MIENYTRLSSRMFTATVVGKDKNGRKITEGRETYKTPSGVYEIKDWARLVEKAAEADGLLPLLEQIKRHVKEYAWMKNASDINVLILAAEDPKTVNINGKTYCTKDLVRYDAPEKAAPISATTLTSLVDYIKENREELRDRMIIQVVNETKVLLYSGLLAERDRETLFEVNALLPRFEYGREYDQESFLISMQSCFKESDDREAVTMLASNIVNTQEATFSDNGTTQQAVMKTGITTKDNVLVPNPVNLIPYRTFLEVEQPASDFVFRVSEGRGGAPVFKLVAADGGVWKSQAVANVKAYLMEALKDIPNRDKITFIA